jgi:hypothetical protein
MQRAASARRADQPPRDVFACVTFARKLPRAGHGLFSLALDPSLRCFQATPGTVPTEADFRIVEARTTESLWCHKPLSPIPCPRGIIAGFIAAARVRPPLRLRESIPQHLIANPNSGGSQTRRRSPVAGMFRTSVGRSRFLPYHNNRPVEVQPSSIHPSLAKTAWIRSYSIDFQAFRLNGDGCGRRGVWVMRPFFLQSRCDW